MKIYFLIISILYIFILLLSDALLRPFMMDEGMSIQVAVKFLTQLQYAFYPEISMHKGSFEPGMSIGWLSTWPGGLGWILGGTIFSARVAHILYFLSLLGLVYYTSHKLLKTNSLTLWTCVLLFACLSIKFIPNLSDIILYGMGEYSGGLWILIAFLISIYAPKFSCFLFGCTLFFTKTIFLPYCLLGVLFLLLFHRFPVKKYSLFFGIFISPLLLWLLLIYWKTGGDGLLLWLQGRGFHLSYAKTGTGAPHTLNTLVEWNSFTLPMKLKIYINLVLGFFSSLFFFFYRKKISFFQKNSPAFSLLFLGHAFLMILFSIWYFYFHAEMWLRHLIPTLLISYFFIIFTLIFGIQKWMDSHFYKKNIGLKFQKNMLIILAILLSLKFKLELDRIQQDLTGIQNADLFSMNCHNNLEQKWGAGPADIDFKICGFDFPKNVNLGNTKPSD